MLQLQRRQQQQQQHCTAAPQLRAQNFAARARNYERHMRLAHRRQQQKQTNKKQSQDRSRNIVRHNTKPVAAEKGIIGAAATTNRQHVPSQPADKCQKIHSLTIRDRSMNESRKVQNTIR